MHKLMFKFGSLGLAICAALLLIAVFASVFLQREFTDGEKLIALLIAVIVGAWWWLAMLRRLRRREGL
jgi:hypothetical protein